MCVILRTTSLQSSSEKLELDDDISSQSILEKSLSEYASSFELVEPIDVLRFLKPFKSDALS